jgi:hypothetical protein
MRSLSLLFTLPCLFLLSSCGASRIFSADFNSDPVGARPNASPPGPPTGDLIYLTAGSSDPLVVADVPGFSSRGARYSNINIPIYARYVGFMSTEITPGQRYYVHWIGRLENFTDATPPLDIWFGDSHFQPALSFRFHNGNVALQASSGVSPAYEVIGTYQPDTNHVISIQVNVETGMYHVGVIQPGDVLNSGFKPVLSTAPFSTRRPTLYMRFGTDASSAASYAIDEVYIGTKPVD